MQNQINDKIRVYAMGGVSEIGSNMTVIELNGDIFIVDAGLMHPKDEMLGVDSVIPDTTYLEQNKDRIKAILLTHAHQAHIGGLPYIIKKVKAPIYGTMFTLALSEQMFKDAQISKRPMMVTIDPDKDVTISGHRISFFRTNHSVPDSIGIAFHTTQGAIIHTGDFKFDYTQVFSLFYQG